MLRPRALGSSLELFIVLTLLVRFKIRSSLSDTSTPQTYKIMIIYKSSYWRVIQWSTFKDEIGAENAKSIVQSLMFVSIGTVNKTEYPPGRLLFTDANSHARTISKLHLDSQWLGCTHIIANPHRDFRKKAIKAHPKWVEVCNNINNNNRSKEEKKGNNLHIFNLQLLSNSVWNPVSYGARRIFRNVKK